MKQAHTFPSAPGKPHQSGEVFVGSWLVYTGLFLIAVLGIILVHEFGHYLAFRQRGYEAVTITFNPFMGKTTSPNEVVPEDMAWIILGGKVFNLSVAAIAALNASKTGGIPRSMLRMYAAHAFLIEGIVVLAGLFVQETVTDFGWLEYLGVSPAFIACLGAVFAALAGGLLYRLWTEFGGGTPKRQAFLALPMVLYLLGGAAAASGIEPLPPSFIMRFMLLGCILVTVYLAGLITLFPLVSRHRVFDREGSELPYSLRSGVIWLLSGMVVWVLCLV